MKLWIKAILFLVGMTTLQQLVYLNFQIGNYWKWNNEMTTFASKSPQQQQHQTQQQQHTHQHTHQHKQQHTHQQQEHLHFQVAHITFSHMKSFDHWTNVILPATDLFIPTNDVYYVVLSNHWEQTYNAIKGTDERYQRIVPLFVNCPEGHFGESPCCKQELGLIQFQDEILVDNAGNGTSGTTTTKSYDWIMYMDDDMYIRKEALETWLNYMNYAHDAITNKVNITHDPIVLSSDIGHGLGQSGYLPVKGPGKNGMANYECIGAGGVDDHYNYPWGQPIVYNQPAFQIVLKAFRLGGLVKQCREYGVTHDAGNAILHWMY